jgi:hypothetical protein
MDYGQLLSDSFRIALDTTRRYLWVFGFFVGSGGFYDPSGMGSKNGGTAAKALPGWLLEHPLALGMAVAAGLLLLLAFAVLQIISLGALTVSVADIERRQPGGFDRALEAGLRHFWRVAGLQLLLGGIVIGWLLLLVAPPVVMIFGGAALKVAGTVWLLAIILPTVVLAVVLALIWQFALRYCVLSDAGVGMSAALGWRTFRSHMGDAVLLALLNGVINVGYAFALIAALAFLAIPFFAVGIINLWWGLVPGVIVGLAVVIAAGSWYGVFSHSLWTLAVLRHFSDGTLEPAPPAPAMPAATVNPGGLEVLPPTNLSP